MALQLSYELPTGISGDYWKINWVSMNRDSGLNINVQVMLYLSEAARIAGKQPLMTKNYTWFGSDATDFDATQQDVAGENIIKTAYDKLKSHTDQFFALATDA